MRKAAIRQAAVVALCVLAGGCASADLFAPAQELQPGETMLRTDRSVYTVRVDPAVYAIDFDLTYTNPLNRAVAVPACHSPHPPVLEKRVAGEWVTAYAPIVLMCITPPLVIARGATHEFRFAVRGHRAPNTAPKFEIDEIPGTYRLVWWVGVHDARADAGVGEPLPLELRVSNTFELRF